MHVGDADSDRLLLFREIVEVREYWPTMRDDLKTEVMRRSEAKGFVGSLERHKVISIVARGRSLDFELPEDLWGKLFHALQILANFYQL